MDAVVPKLCPLPGSNRGPFACEANVITNYTKGTVQKNNSSHTMSINLYTVLVIIMAARKYEN